VQKNIPQQEQEVLWEVKLLPIDLLPFFKTTEQKFCANFIFLRIFE
jgi:hypothetical protein